MLKKGAKTPEGPAVEEEKLVSAPRKSRNEIDEIFAAKKRKKPDKVADKGDAKKQEASAAVDGGTKKKAKKKAKGYNKNTEIKENGGRSKERKRTGDGLVIYTEDELGIGKQEAGGTPLCPFDCDCCF